MPCFAGVVSPLANPFRRILAAFKRDARRRASHDQFVPFAAVTKASAMPVCLMWARRSWFARWRFPGLFPLLDHARPIRSFTEPSGLKNSSFQRDVRLKPVGLA